MVRARNAAMTKVDEIALAIREGREADLFACGCVGCGEEAAVMNGEPCACDKRCRCVCTLPHRVEERREFRERVEAIRRGIKR